MCWFGFFFFFFKAKTAYEVRLSFVGSEMCNRDKAIGLPIPGAKKYTHIFYIKILLLQVILKKDKITRQPWDRRSKQV